MCVCVCVCFAQALLGYAGFTTVLGLCAIHVYNAQPSWTIREMIQTLLSVLDTKGLLPFLRAPEVSGWGVLCYLAR